MSNWFLAAVWSVWASGVAEAAGCVRAADGEYYTEEVLLMDKALSGEIATYWEGNKIYALKTLTSSRYEVGEWDIDKRLYNTFGEVPEYCRLAVDQQRGRVYAGCMNHTGRGGLYIYDRHPSQFVPLTEHVDDIFWVHFSGQLYYVDAAHNSLHTCVHGRTQPVPELFGTSVDTCVVDGRGDRIFTFSGRVFLQKMGMMGSVEIPTTSKIDDVAVSPGGDVFGRNGRGIFRVDKDGGNVTQVLVTPEFCMSLALDKDNNFICYISRFNRTSRIVRWVKCQP